jgi:hypothetical protein
MDWALCGTRRGRDDGRAPGGLGNLARGDRRAAAREAMKGDKAVEAGADKLTALSDQAAAKGGLGEKVADELAGDAAFLRKLKPSLIAARAKGALPKDAEPGTATASRPAAPSGAQRPRRSSGPNPFVLAGAAFAAGTVLAKVIDWRGHAHPRR